MGEVVDLSTVLVPLSLFLTVGYHVFLWRSLKKKPSDTTIGTEKLMRRLWFHPIKQGGNQMGTLPVQSLRNSLMEIILVALIAITINAAVAALTNNAYNARDALNSSFFGSQSGLMTHLKYGCASLFLLSSFLYSSMGLGCLIDANMLVNAEEEFSPSLGFSETMLHRGFMFAAIGKRMLCMAFPLLTWMFGPVSMALSSLALVWGLYQLDFGGNLN